MTRSQTNTLFAFALLGPALLYIIVIVAYPLVDTVNLSFTNAGLARTYDWVGWVNYQKIFRSGFTTSSSGRSSGRSSPVSIKMIIGIFGASLLNAAVPGRAIFRMLTLPPWIVPMAIGIFMWGWMYNGQFGMISGLLQRFGLASGPIAFLAHGDTAFGRRSSPMCGSACRW